MRIGQSSRRVKANSKFEQLNMRFGKDNRGISMSELVVVIAIMAVLAAVGVTMIGQLSTWRLNKCFNAFKSAMSETRVQAMSKSAASMTLKVDADGNIVIDKSYDSEEIVGGDEITVTYSNSAGTTDINIIDEELVISYDRSSGTFKPIGTDDDGNKIYCTEVTFTKGNHKKVVKLYTDTGKYEVTD